MSRVLRLAGILSCGLAVACGSGNADPAPSAPSAPSAPASPSATTAPLADGCGDPATATDVVEDPSFELRAVAGGPYVVSEEGRFEITLTPRGEYHVNTQYPASITLTGNSGVRLAKTELGTDDAAEYGEPRARFQVPFTLETPEPTRIAARVDFAVCTPEACMPDCRTIALEVAARSDGASGS